MGEWSHPACSHPHVGRLMGPKPVAGEDQIGFSPGDWNDQNQNIKTSNLASSIFVKDKMAHE